MDSQDKIFLNSEGNNWFKRNKLCLGTKEDLPLYLMNLYDLKPRKVLEVGAANGYRLAEIYKKYKADVYAVEPSNKAIESGKRNWPFINFQKTTAAEMTCDKNLFDLIIVHSVFHWIDRNTLLVSVAKVDEVLKWGGYLIIGDFQTPFPVKRKYHHIKNKKVFTYKLDIRKIFLSTGFYKEIAILSKNHDNEILTGETNLNNYFSASLLRKEELYIELE